MDFFQLNATFLANYSEVDLPNAPSSALILTRYYVQRVVVPLVVVFGIVGNMCSFTVLCHKRMRSSTNIYLAALSICDMLYLILSLTLAYIHCSYTNQPTSAFYYIPYGRFLCDLFSNCAVWLIVTFTVERYIGVCQPLRGKAWCTVGKARMAILGAFVFSFFVTAPEIFETKISVLVADDNVTLTRVCTSTKFAEPVSYQFGYYWFYVCVFSLLPLVLLCLFNTLLIRSVWQATKLRKTLMSGNSAQFPNDDRSNREQNRITVMLITVVLVFILCNLPWTTILLVTSLQSDVEVKTNRNALRIAGNIANLLVQVNSSCNFILYSYFSSRFRNTIRYIMCSWNGSQQCTKRGSPNNTELTHLTPVNRVNSNSARIGCGPRKQQSFTYANEKRPNSYRTALYTEPVS